MVEKKTLVWLMIIAIVLSLVSVVLTVTSLSLKTPEIRVLEGDSEDSQNGRVSLVINPPAS